MNNYMIDWMNDWMADWMIGMTRWLNGWMVVWFVCVPGPLVVAPEEPDLELALLRRTNHLSRPVRVPKHVD